MQTIDIINGIIANFFEAHPETQKAPANQIMPELLAAGVFSKDKKNGLPFRKFLRGIDKENQLEKMPQIYAERHDTGVYWYLVRDVSKLESETKEPVLTNKQKAILAKANSDETYLVNLCDELLQAEASRQHTFDFLLGDMHKKGKLRTKLPVDTYYEDLNLVIEFMKQYNQEESSTSEDEPLTISGVTRNEQRERYNKRRRDVLKKKEIHHLEIEVTAFDCNSKKQLTRDKAKDVKVLRSILKRFLK